MMNLEARILAKVASITLLTAACGSATVIGNLFTGSSGTVTVSLNSVIFNNDPAAIGGGNSDVATGTNLAFAGCSGALNSPGCLQTQEGITVLSPFTAASVPSNNFLTFAAHPQLVFSVTGVGPGSGNTNCATAVNPGDSCSVFAGSPILLTVLSSTSTLASLAVQGKASDTGQAGLPTGTNYNGGFSQTLTNLLPNGTLPTPENIQLYFCPSGTCTAGDFQSGKSITSSQSGSFFATAVPEPGVLSTVAVGLLLVLVGRARATNRFRS